MDSGNSAQPQKRGRYRQDTRAGLAALDNAVFHRRCDKERHAQHQQHQPGALQCSRQQRQLFELLLKNSVELKTKQYLGAEDQEPIFIQCSFELGLEFHFFN